MATLDDRRADQLLTEAHQTERGDVNVFVGEDRAILIAYRGDDPMGAWQTTIIPLTLYDRSADRHADHD